MDKILDVSMQKSAVNDFSIQVATVNGSGSQSANLVLMRAIFQMGVPVSGKNIFPSNISGLPTWFTIRANPNGYMARKAELDFMIAMNPQTAKEDVMTVQPGGALLADEALGLKGLRKDLHYYEVPFSKLAEQVTQDFRLKKLLTNMIYVGVMTHLLSLDLTEVQKAIQRQFKNKSRAAELNMNAIQAGLDFAITHLTKTDPFRIEKMNSTQGKIMIDGNGAAALGAVFGGCTVVAWYPITPSTSLVEQLTEYMNKYRIDSQTGKANFAIVQTEDELAAIGMVIGASWAGARAMTATSGPGSSLMSEFSGLAYFAEIPAVLWDVQRVGPSTGLPTRTSQGDILSNYILSHGDTRHIMLIPATVEECFLFAQQAFNLAEKFQTPVICMSDLDLGMNHWMSDEFQYPESIPIDRGKVLSEKDLEKIGTFSRYLDVDGDGIPFRTIPGNTHPDAPYFTRGSGHDVYSNYSEQPENHSALMDRLYRKFQGARSAVPSPIIDGMNASVGIIAYGSTHHAIDECRAQLRTEYGIDTDYLRIRALPPNSDLSRFLEHHERIYVVEQNRDGQMRSILSMEFPQTKSNLRSVLHYSGIPIDARFVANAIIQQERGGE
jgi:2-oxoglutarate/2-oxoacid ferredoxin oxidoreductase subunit alpha